MKLKFLSAAGCIALLVACSNDVNTFYRSGVQVAKLESDMLDCEVDALAAAPVAFQIRQSSSSVFVSSYYCGAFCAGGTWNSSVYSVDVNKDLRNRVMQQCMAERGYSPATVSKCPDSVTRQVQPGVTNVLPDLTPESCVIDNKDGTFQLVTRG